jgi:hypothetical protein
MFRRMLFGRGGTRHLCRLTALDALLEVSVYVRCSAFLLVVRQFTALIFFVEERRVFLVSSMSDVRILIIGGAFAVGISDLLRLLVEDRFGISMMAHGDVIADAILMLSGAGYRAILSGQWLGVYGRCRQLKRSSRSLLLGSGPEHTAKKIIT